jgi:hypothetical protein
MGSPFLWAMPPFYRAALPEKIYLSIEESLLME